MVAVDSATVWSNLQSSIMVTGLPSSLPEELFSTKVSVHFSAGTDERHPWTLLPSTTKTKHILFTSVLKLVSHSFPCFRRI